MISIIVIGSGNVAQHLIKIINKTADLQLVQVFARNTEEIKLLINNDLITSNYNEIKNADLYIIAVLDDAIEMVSEKLPFKNKLVIHTSGSISIDVLNSKNRKGVFYPLQTFSKNKEVDFTEIPICLEAENENDYKILEDFSKSISNKVYKINSVQRKAIHVSAVFVCNFVNHMYVLGNEICQENQIPFDILKPLIKETASKIEILSPIEAQTGPAKREDISTINKHLNFLKNENQKDIYKTITKSIIDHGKKL